MSAFAAAGTTAWLEGEPNPHALGARAHKPAAATTNGAVVELTPTSATLSVTKEDDAAAGCSAAGEPTSGAVEHALGIVFCIALLARLRTTWRRAGDERASPSDRVPYRNLRELGVRESLASISDDR